MSGAREYSPIGSDVAIAGPAGLQRLGAARSRTALDVPDAERLTAPARARPRGPRRRPGMDLAGSILFVMVWTLLVFSAARYAGLDHLLVKSAVPLGILTCIPLVALVLLTCYQWFVIGSGNAAER